MSEDERIFKPVEYPIDIDIYDAFLKFELQGEVTYGIEPEDWHQFYHLFAAGFTACSDFVIEKIKRSKTDG